MNIRNWTLSNWITPIFWLLRGSMCLSFFGIAPAFAQVYLSPAGSDSNAGTQASPVQTPQRAQALARLQGSAGVHIYAGGGTYPLASTLALTAQDSGEVWQQYNAERPVFSGAQAVTGGWTLHDSGNNIYQASVPAGVDFRQIYVNGVRAIRVRSTNSTLLGLFTSATFNASTGYTATGGALSTYGNPSNIELVYNLSWQQVRSPVASVTGTTITMAQPAWGLNTGGPTPTTGSGTYDWIGYTTASQTPTWIENAYEFLSSSTPGQFYLNKSTNILYYVPRAGENMATATVTYPALQTLVSETGSSNVIFSGLTFADSTWLQPNSTLGFCEMQGNMYADTVTTRTPKTSGTGTGAYFDAYKQMPGAVAINGGTGNTFDRCTFQRLGASGITVDNNAISTTLAGNLITDASGNGIDISNPWTDTHTSTPVTGTVVKDNSILNISVEYWGGEGIMQSYAANSLITHNVVNGTGYCGISLGWGHGDSSAVPNAENNNVVSYNDVYNAMQKMLDGGGIYSNGSTNAESIFGNHIHNMTAIANPGLQTGIYNDDGSTNKVSTGNLVNDTLNENIYYNDTGRGNTAAFNIIGGTYINLNPNSETTGSYAPITAVYPGLPADNVSWNQVVLTASQRPASILQAAGLEPAYGGTVYAPGPSIPTGLTASTPSGGGTTLTWTAPVVVGSGITGYEIWVNGAIVGTSASASYTYPALQPSTTYNFIVRARDSNASLSQPSAPISLTTSSSLVAATPALTY